MILGIFDSGLGGLTVLKEILKDNTFEKIVYFGDTARLPYGDKDKSTLLKYAKEDIKFLLDKGVNEIVVACGTISTNVLEDIKDDYDLKIIGIVDVMCDKARNITKNNKIGVIATPATIKTHAFKNKLKEFDVYEIPCPLFTPLIEAGKKDSEEMDKALNEYLAPLKREGIDTLILGCTHYPILSEKINKYFNNSVSLINAGELLNKELNVNEKKTPLVDIYVSGDTNDFVYKAKELIDSDILRNIKNK